MIFYHLIFNIIFKQNFYQKLYFETIIQYIAFMFLLLIFNFNFSEIFLFLNKTLNQSIEKSLSSKLLFNL